MKFDNFTIFINKSKEPDYLSKMDKIFITYGLSMPVPVATRSKT